MNRLVVPIAAGVVTLVVGALFIPTPPRLSPSTNGDPELIAYVLENVDPGVRDHLSVAVIRDGEVTSAQFGADDDTEYEIGSVSKTFTAALLADAIERGEVSADTKLGDLLDLGDSPASDITLEELATQSSGLPRLPSSLAVALSSILTLFTAGDPYGYDVPALESQARDAAVGEKAYNYSNFGIALLGQALAAAADTSYATLVQERILTPLGMDRSSVPVTSDGLPSEAPTGFTASGRSSSPWTMDAYAPAGGIRSTTADMVTYLSSVIDGTGPGVSAADPLASAGDGREIGYAWLTDDDRYTWHNGMTGGFASFVGFDRETGQGVVILSDTAVSVDSLGFDLMKDAR